MNIILLDKETFDHDATDFSLNGQHKQIKCTSCHKASKKYSEAVADCFSCHKKDDVHKEKLGNKCYQCHSETSWKKIKFDHSKTHFPLRGKHKETSCGSCHPDNRHKNTAKNCYSCHAINDAHKGRYDKKCATCHGETDWQKNHFNHDKQTKFKLLGEHKNTACDSCHTHTTGTIFNKHPQKSCIACHKTDDVHNGQNGNKCQKCHGETHWKKSKFDHDKDTKFKLRGTHKQLTCITCHPGESDSTQKKLKMDCYSCHKLDDSHKGQQGQQCDSCHNDLGWKHLITFNHDITHFPLLGQHAIIPCEECHLSSAFKDASVNCISCHGKDDTHTKTLGTACNQCHNPNGWKLWQFDHDRQTQFKLVSAHKGLHCKACHKNAMDKSIDQSPTCNVCHLQDDIHRGEFGNHCDSCHNSEKFEQIHLLN